MSCCVSCKREHHSNITGFFVADQIGKVCKIFLSGNTLLPLCRTSPKLLTALSVGTMNLQELEQTAQPQHHYVPAADRYAVVPDQGHAQMFGGMSVPQAPVVPVPASPERSTQ